MRLAVLLCILLPAPASALPYFPSYKINGWTVSCDLPSFCMTNRYEAPPYISFQVETKKIIVQIREDCLFEGQAPPVVIARHYHQDGKLYDQVEILLNKATVDCGTKEIPTGWVTSTMELVDLMLAATEQR